MNRPLLICASVFALTAVTGISQARIINGGRQDALPPGRQVVPAPARTVVVPPGETVVLTPVYPVHYPKPIYMTPPLYGNYVPAYYLPAAYFQATPLTPVASPEALTAGASPDGTVRRTESPETVTTRRTATTTRSDPAQSYIRDYETFDK